MLILTLRTDNPQAEIGLYKGAKKLDYEKWVAHRQLAENIHTKILDLLKTHNQQWSSVQAIVCYAGPGSFTGLRIGASVANALGYSLNIPVIGSMSDDWIALGINKILAGESDEVVTIEYGSAPTITKQRK